VLCLYVKTTERWKTYISTSFFKLFFVVTGCALILQQLLNLQDSTTAKYFSKQNICSYILSDSAFNTVVDSWPVLAGNLVQIMWNCVSFICFTDQPNVGDFSGELHCWKIVVASPNPQCAVTEIAVTVKQVSRCIRISTIASRVFAFARIEECVKLISGWQRELDAMQDIDVQREVDELKVRILGNVKEITHVEHELDDIDNKRRAREKEAEGKCSGVWSFRNSCSNPGSASYTVVNISDLFAFHRWFKAGVSNLGHWHP